MLLGKYAYESIKGILEDLKVTKGTDAVKSWCSDFGMDVKHCAHCQEKTPFLHSVGAYDCAICGNKLSEGKNE